AEAFGADRRAAVCRELTKTYEEVRRDALGELADWAADGVRGEVTLVVSGDDGARPAALHEDDLRRLVTAATEAGLSTKDAVAAVAADTGLPKRRVYAAAH